MALAPKVSKAAKAAQHTTAQLQRFAASPIPSLRLVSDSAPPASPDRGSDMADLLEDGDIKCHIWSLPNQGGKGF